MHICPSAVRNFLTINIMNTKLLNKLKEVSTKNPEHRMGQIIINSLRDTNLEDISMTLYYMEDDELIERLSRLLED